jgi:hypothetical protein
MTTTVDLLNYFRTHLADFELPTLWSLTVTTSSTGPTVSVHLACHEPAEIASEVLAGADTLSEVTTETWRVPNGYSMHLAAMSQLPNGTTVWIYGDLPLLHYGLGADLAPDASTTIPLGALRHLATLGEVTV